LFSELSAAMTGACYHIHPQSKSIVNY